MEWLRRADRASGGLGVDVALYALSAIFAVVTAAKSSLAAHQAWGAVAALGYGAAAAVSIGQWGSRWYAIRGPGPAVFRWMWWRAGGRSGLVVAAFAATAVCPIALQSLQRAAGRTDRAQEEVHVIEDAARRWLETGTPYLSRAAIAALPQGDRLTAYLPYQPGMAVFGLPRAAAGMAAWTDARVWFAVATIAAILAAIRVLRGAGVAWSPLVRAGQAATVLPICALALATGGDDLPVLALCLLAFALAATGRFGGAGVAIGAAAALKLFAWPVAVVLGCHAVVRRRGLRFIAGAAGLPLATALPAVVKDPAAMVENVLAYPFGHGLVASPAASPLPGHLIVTAVPDGRVVVYALLAATAAAIAVALVRHPPRTAADAARVTALGLLAAMLLLPSTRFGYLLYPVALLVWVPALRTPPPAVDAPEPGPADLAAAGAATPPAV